MFEVSYSTMRPRRSNLLFRSVFVLRVVEVLITEIHLWWERCRNRVWLCLKSACCTAHNESSSQYTNKIYDIYMQIGRPVIPRCQQVLGEKRILMKYLLLAGHSIIQSCSLFSTKRVNSSFNVACSPLTNLFKKEQRKSAGFFFSSSSGRTAERAAVGGSGRIWCDASGGKEESSDCRNKSWGHDTLQT